jgi:HEPN domain-containing protein
MRDIANTPQGWFAKADADLEMAELGLRGSDRVMDLACYHAQQCAEKYLKGYLFARGITFRLVHDLVYLVGLCVNAERDFDTLLVAAGQLVDYASTTRYPVEGTGAATREDAREAIVRAKAIRDFVLARIPVAGGEEGEDHEAIEEPDPD